APDARVAGRDRLGQRGTFVVADAASPLNSSLRLVITLDEEAGIHHLFELRLILEAEAAALAAQRHDERHLNQMDAAIEQMSAALAGGRDGDGEAFIDADLRFHLAVAEATGNRLVLHSMQAVRDVVRRALITVYSIPSSPESA